MGASNRTEMLRLRGVLLTILRLLGLRARLLSILAFKRRFRVSLDERPQLRTRQVKLIYELVRISPTAPCVVPPAAAGRVPAGSETRR